MLTENEVATIIHNDEIHQEVKRLKKEFKQKEAPNLEISDHDFLSLVFLIPTVGIAMANDNISFKEEMELNKKARKVSKGGFFMKQDPVVHAMKFLIKNYKAYEESFYSLIANILNKFAEMDVVKSQTGEVDSLSDHEYEVLIMKSPHFYVRLMRAFFMASAEADISTGRKLNKPEFEKVLDIGKRLDIQDTVLFKKFLTHIDVK